MCAATKFRREVRRKSGGTSKRTGRTKQVEDTYIHYGTSTRVDGNTNTNLIGGKESHHTNHTTKVFEGSVEEKWWNIRQLWQGRDCGWIITSVKWHIRPGDRGIFPGFSLNGFLPGFIDLR